MEINDFFLINKKWNIHASYNEKTKELKFIKNGELLDTRDMSNYSEEQLKKYIEGIINGLE